MEVRTYNTFSALSDGAVSNTAVIGVARHKTYASCISFAGCKWPGSLHSSSLLPSSVITTEDATFLAV